MTDTTTFTTISPPPTQETLASPAPAREKKKRGPKQPLSQEALERLAAARTKAVEVRRVKAEERRMQVAQVMDRLMKEKEIKLEAKVRNDLERERVRKIVEARAKGSSRQIIIEDPESDASEDESVAIPPPRSLSHQGRSGPMAAPNPSTIAPQRRSDVATLKRFLF